MDPSSHNALQGSVASLRTSMHLLDSSLSILDAGVGDYPRLARVLQTTRHFELLPESTLQAAQMALQSEIVPEIHRLLAHADTHLDKLARREQSLMAKAQLQEGRLVSGSRGEDNSGAGEGQLTEAEMRKARQLRAKKERLSFAIGRLELEAGQRERQLRKSMAATQ